MLDGVRCGHRGFDWWLDMLCVDQCLCLSGGISQCLCLSGGSRCVSGGQFLKSFVIHAILQKAGPEGPVKSWTRRSSQAPDYSTAVPAVKPVLKAEPDSVRAM